MACLFRSFSFDPSLTVALLPKLIELFAFRCAEGLSTQWMCGLQAAGLADPPAHRVNHRVLANIGGASRDTNAARRSRNGAS